MTDAGQSERATVQQLELTERQRERFEEIKAECKDADPGLPEQTDEQLFSSLLDTWDAVNDGLYSGIGRDDIRVSTHDGHPSLKIGDVEVMLRTHFEGVPPESTETDYLDEHVWFVLDFDEEYFDGLLEITPEFIPPEEDGDE